MKIAVIGTGFIGRILGGALAKSGQDVIFGSRDSSNEVALPALPIAEAIQRSEAVILAVPGSAVRELVAENGPALEGKLVIDATNRMGGAVSNCRSDLPATVRYARAFNTLGGENMADPVFPDGTADMFFSAAQVDRGTVEEIIKGVGLRPVYVGADQEELIDALFRLWIALAVGQKRGRRLAFRLLEG